MKSKTEKIEITFSRSSFFTALILSLETAPSGQFNLDPLRKYFSAPRLHVTKVDGISVKLEENSIFINSCSNIMGVMHREDMDREKKELGKQ